MKEQYILVQTLSNTHLEEFTRCPYKFYLQYLKKQPYGCTWRQLVQMSVNQIVKHFYQIPVGQRTAFTVLQLIERYWKHIHVSYFQSKKDYYFVLAKVSDHLLKFLLKDEQRCKPPLFLYEKFHVFIKELEVNLSLHFEVGHWDEDRYIVTKYMLDDHHEIFETFVNMTIVFTKHAFNKMPYKVNIYSLLSGRQCEYYIDETMYPQALNLLKTLKQRLENPESFRRKIINLECGTCPMSQICGSFDNEQEEEKVMMYM
jgi:hypothetical protein